MRDAGFLRNLCGILAGCGIDAGFMRDAGCGMRDAGCGIFAGCGKYAEFMRDAESLRDTGLIRDSCGMRDTESLRDADSLRNICGIYTEFRRDSGGIFCGIHTGCGISAGCGIISQESRKKGLPHSDHQTRYYLVSTNQQATYTCYVTRRSLSIGVSE
jgi:hypothetical protein